MSDVHDLRCKVTPCSCVFVKERSLDARVYLWLMAVGVVTSLIQSRCVEKSDSFSLLSDTLHVVLDVGIFAAGFLLARAEIRAAKELHGWKHFAEIIQLLFLVATAWFIFVEAEERLTNPAVYIALRWMLVGGIAGFLGNLAQIIIGWRMKRAKIVQFHNLTDLLCSAAAITSGVLMLYGSEFTVDITASRVIGGIIGLGALVLMCEAAGLIGKHTH